MIYKAIKDEHETWQSLSPGCLREMCMEHPQPDDKNWTWVLERPCPDCRFRCQHHCPPRHWGDVTYKRGGLAGGSQPRGAGAPASPRRPDGGVIWSALEYGCHVRDVFVLFDERLRLMLTQQEPTFLNWDQDATAIAKRYWEDDPMTVREALREAGTAWPTPSTRCATTSGHGQARAPTGHVSPSNRLVGTFLHDPIHHLWDVTRGFEALA